MKFIKIFLASSILEFENERRQLGDFIRTLNDSYVRRGIYFELTICEDLNNALTMERKQQEYNQYIRESQYFYVLFGRRAGAYTIEEFDVALEQFRSSGSPRIFTYFLNLPKGEEPEQSVIDFMERLDKQIGHYYSTFVHMDAIKLNLLLELVRDPKLNSQIEFEDGQAILDAQPVLSLEHVPLYSKNESVQKLLKEQQRMNEEFAHLALEYGKNPADTKMLGEMMKLGDERARISDSLHRMEKDMLGLCSQAEEKRQSKERLNWREKKAIECVDLGDYEGAKNILRDAQWEQEIDQLEERIDLAKESIREYISGKKALISTLMATGLNEETVEEIDAIYQRCCTLAKNHGVEWNILYDYAHFLFLQRRCYLEAIRIGEELSGYYKKESENFDSKRAKLANLLGRVYFWNQDYVKSEQNLRKSYEIYCRLAEKESEIYERDLSLTCSGLAVLLEKINRLEEAGELFQKALEIQRKLVKVNPQVYEEDLAYVCNDYGILLGKINRLEEAESIHREALEIRRKRQTDALHTRDRVARSCSNLARILYQNDQMKEAESLEREALEISRSLMEVNPNKYQPDVALNCNNLAVSLVKTDRLEEAEVLHREALTIRRRLVEANPKAYKSDLAISCANLARLLERENRLEEAEGLYWEALEVKRELAKSDSQAYKEDLAQGCIDLANFLGKVYRLQEAKELGLEALALYRQLAERNPDAFEASLANACIHVGYFLKTMEQFAEAEPFYREALEIHRRLAAENPETYTSSLADCVLQFGILLSRMNRNHEAEKALQEALVLCQSLVRENPRLHQARLAVVYDNLGILWKDHNPKKANEVLEKALRIYARLALEHPKIYLSEKARISFDLASLLEKQKEEKKAEVYYEEAWEIYNNLAQASTEAWYPYLSAASYNLVLLKERLGKLEEAEHFCRKALKADLSLASCNPSIYWKYPAESISELARILCKKTEACEEAKELYQEALSIYKGHAGMEKEIQHIEHMLQTKFGLSGN